MKNLFLFLMMAATLASCNSTKLATNKVKDAVDKFLADHNYQQTNVHDDATNSTIYTVSLENFYETDKVKAICSKADVTLKIADAKIEISANCPGAEQQIRAVMEQLFKAVVFKN